MTSLRLVGPGRAGGALAKALAAVGWTVDEPLRRGDDLGPAASGVDLVVIATPDADTGARRLRGAWFAIAGDDVVAEVANALGGRTFTVCDGDRAAYHAAAVIASNHLVALLGQAERVGALAGVPFEALLDLVKTTIDNVSDLGPTAALTGPASRGDTATIERHLAALPLDERAAYEVMVDEVRRLMQGRPRTP